MSWASKAHKKVPGREAGQGSIKKSGIQKDAATGRSEMFFLSGTDLSGLYDEKAWV